MNSTRALHTLQQARRQRLLRQTALLNNVVRYLPKLAEIAASCARQSMPERTPTIDVAVIGGGIIGLSAAWRLSQRGYSVAIFDSSEPGRAASWKAAGMLSPAAEIGFEELDLYHFGRESLRRWPGFARELEQESSSSVGYREEGTLVVAVDRDDAEALRRLYRFQQEKGVPVDWMAGYEALEREPLLAPGLPAAIYSPEDHQVDNRAVVVGLCATLKRSKLVQIYEHMPVRAVHQNDNGVQIELGGSSVEARVALLAAGAWSNKLQTSCPIPVRPIKGQILTLKPPRGVDLTHVVRGPDAYLVPKSDGRIALGATSEDVGFDDVQRAGAIFRLLEGATEIVPGVEEMELIEADVSFRPASRDHAPIIGWSSPRVMVATGHYRHGVLLAPATADEVAAEVDAKLRGNSETSDWIRPFSPKRFT